MGHTRHQWRAAALVGAVAAGLALVAATPGGASSAAGFERPASPSGGATLAERSRSADDHLTPAFRSAARRYDVPPAVLFALGYAETHLDSHDGEPSFANGYGVMHLVANPTNHTLATAARLTGIARERLKSDSAANIDGAAAVLRHYADRTGLDRAERGDIGAWYPIIARYAHSSSEWTARLYADTVRPHRGRRTDRHREQRRPGFAPAPERASGARALRVGRGGPAPKPRRRIPRRDLGAGQLVQLHRLGPGRR
jgi:hypothetical protein